MKTNLFGKSNAVLTEDNGNIIGIIECKGGENVDITKKLVLAIREHFTVPDDADIKLIDLFSLLRPKQPVTYLTNQEPVKFSAEWVEDEQEIIRDFEISIAVTYK